MARDRLAGRLPYALERPAVSEKDILSEERSRRSPMPRGVRRLWPGNWMVGRLGLSLLAAFILFGSVWVLFFSAGEGSGPGSAPSFVPPVSHPEAGRELSVAEKVRFSSIGRPLYLGPSGLPVVEHGVTGDVREVTPVEVRFLDEVPNPDVPFVHAGHNNVVWNPGPSGWGMWWQDQSESRELQPDFYYDRMRWRKKQEDELRYAAALLSLGLREAVGFNLELWQEGPGARLYHLMEELRSGYPVVSNHGSWAAVPMQWTCDGSLEAQFTAHATQGCPGDEYHRALNNAWMVAGSVADYLQGIARLAVTMDSMRARDLYESAALDTMVYFLADLLDSIRLLNEALNTLRDVSLREDLLISVSLFQEG